MREKEREKVLTSNSILPVSPKDIFVLLNVSFFYITIHVQDCGKKRNQETIQEPSFQKGLGKLSAFYKWLFLAWVFLWWPDPSGKVAGCFAHSLLPVTSSFTLVLLSFCTYCIWVTTFKARTWDQFSTTTDPRTVGAA